MQQSAHSAGGSRLERSASQRVTRAMIDLDAIVHNIAVLRSRCAPSVHMMAVVKADAYGHGAIPVARACLAAGATWLGVATVDEGVALRQAGIAAPILLLGPSLPIEYGRALQYDLALAIGSSESGRELARLACARGTRAHIHVKVDTGMLRFGIPAARAIEEIDLLAAEPGVVLDGIFTHLAGSEEEDKSAARAQLSLFDAVLDALARHGITVGLRHASNSGGILDLPDAHYDLVRAGIAVYGYHPAGPDVDQRGLQPALSLVSRLVRVEQVPAGAGVGYNHTYRTDRPSVLGLVPIGYADGLPRLVSNRGHMLVRGQRCAIVGRISMDQTVIDLTDVANAALGDEVVVIGRQGDGAIDAAEVGAHAGTSAYETLCRISPRVPRDYCSTDSALRYHEG